MDTIFGHSWTAIQRAQQGGSLAEPLPEVPVKPQASDDDRALLRAHGLEGLKRAGLHGVLDRLTRAGVVRDAQG